MTNSLEHRLVPHWELAHADVPADESLYRVRITNDAQHGWLAGRGGSLLQYREGGWVRQPSPPVPATVALRADGESGWAVGAAGALLRFADHQWSKDDAASALTTSDLHDVCLSADGRSGWAVGERGTLLKYDQAAWSVVPEVAATYSTRGFSHLWCSEDASAAWAAAGPPLPADPAMIALQSGSWRKQVWLRPGALWAASQRSAWMANSLSLLRFDAGRWNLNTALLPPAFEGRTEGPLLSFWFTPDGSAGWSAGAMGMMLRWKGGWSFDRQFSSLTSAPILSLWLTPDESDGWAVGERGTLLRFRPLALGPATLQPVGDASLTHLSGDFDLVLPAPATNVVSVFLTSENGGSEFLAKDEFRAAPATSDHRTLRLTFTPAGAARAARLSGLAHSMTIIVAFEHPSLFTGAMYKSRPFSLAGPSEVRRVPVLVAAVLLANLLIFLAATRIRLLRTIVLSPVGSAVLGLVLGKYLLTDWMIRFVKPLKLAMFRDFRRNFAASSGIAAWGQRLYVPPVIELPEACGPDAGDPETAWERAFVTLLGMPRRRLWLLQGPSGLGKTALLEKWTGLALRRGETPLLLRLRSDLPAGQEAAAQMAQFGDVEVKDGVALDLLTGGGFVLLLDGLNEDRAPEATREFVRQVTKRNLVVLTSQFDPGWKDMIDTHPILLRPFGPPQLRKLLDDRWADAILGSPRLAEIARLPATARLLARFVERTGNLPDDRLQIYGDLREGLEPLKLLNLEERAWLLFKANEFDFSPDSALPPELCEAAVAQGVLTRQAQRYRFPHEMIQRYLVACYLDRQDARPLTEWHVEIKPGLGREYWIEVLDFWGEIWGQRAAAERSALAKYERFLRDSAQLSVAIFASRLYPHYDRLRASGAIAGNPELIAWAASLLAGAVRA